MGVLMFSQYKQLQIDLNFLRLLPIDPIRPSHRAWLPIFGKWGESKMSLLQKTLLLLAVLTISNCSGSGLSSRKSEGKKSDAHDGSGPAVSANKDLQDCNLNPCSEDNSKVQTTGANLVDIRCDFQNPAAATFDIGCRAVARQPTGVEVAVTSANLLPTTSVVFAPPTFKTSDVVARPVCTVNQVALTQSCTVKTSNTTLGTTLGFSLAVTDTATPTANHSAKTEVSLVGAVSVAWGHVTNSGLATTVGAGFSPMRMDPLGDGKSGLLIEPASVCSDGESTFYTNTNSIWELRKDGGVYIFAGGPGLRPLPPVPEDLTSRLKIRLGAQIAMACGKNYLVVSEVSQHRILAIPRTGPVVILAGKVDVDGVAVAGISGDGGPANLATLNLAYPGSGVAVVQGATGDTIYFADTGNHRLRKISPDQKISTIAGKTESGISPDGTLAKDAILDLPQNVAVGPSGEVYFTSVSASPNAADPTVNDYFASVRKIDSAGKLATVVGVADSLLPTVTGPSLILTDPQWGGVTPIISVAVAADNSVYVGVSETFNVIKLVNGVGSLVFDTKAETSYPGILGYLLPYGLSLDPLGNLLVASLGVINRSVYSVDGLGTVKAIIGNYNILFNLQGPMNSLLLDDLGLALDPVSLDFYAANSQNTFIFKGSSSDAKYHTVAGCLPELGSCTAPAATSQAATASLIHPTSLAVRVNPSVATTSGHGDIYYSDDRHTVNKITPAGVLTKVAGSFETLGFSGDTGLATSAKLNNPAGLAVARDGTVYIADSANNRIRRVDLSSPPKISTIAGVTTQPATLPSGLIPNGDGGPATSAWIQSPASIAVDDRDLTKKVVYVADKKQNRIRKIDGSSAIITTVLGTSDNTDFNDDLAVLRSTPVTITLFSTAATKFTVTGYQPLVGTEVTLTTTVALPTGFVKDTKTYYVILPVTTVLTAGPSTTFQLSPTMGGTGIKATLQGSGSHSLITNQIKLYEPSAVAIGRNGDLYVIDHPVSGDRLSLMSINSGVTRFKTLFTTDGGQARDCSVGKTDVSAPTASDLKTKLQTSLSTMCKGSSLRNIAVGNTCADTNPDKRKFSLVFSQIFQTPTVMGFSTNENQVIQLQMPCF